jgi:mono/diheme cytochrome c family protein
MTARQTTPKIAGSRRSSPNRRAMLVARIFASALCSLGAGCKATPPGKIETAIMTRAKHRLFVGEAKGNNPLAATAENIKDGQEVFSHYCVACHGLDGQNTGVPFADRMSPPVPSLASKDVQAYRDGQLKWVIDNGLWPSGMPGSKGILNDEEIWSAVLYIRHLPRAGSLGEPAMYSGEDCTPTDEPTAQNHERAQDTARQKSKPDQRSARH